MKKNIILIIILIIISASNYIHAQISRDAAFKIVQEEVLGNDFQSKNIYVSQKPLPPSNDISTFYNKIITPDFESWFFFIDDNPLANWGHDCRYVFVNSTNGKYTIENANLPPSLGEMEVLHEKAAPSEPGERVIVHKSTNNICTSENDYAVIISGGMDKYNNHERYWNDCSFIYSVLVNKYHFDKSKIYVLMADGTNPAADRHLIQGGYDSSPLDLDGDGRNDIQYAATKSNISSVFNQLSNIVTNQDNVFIFTTDHGGSGSTLILWGETMTSAQFATEVNKVNAAKTINVVMEQCYSGGYISALAGSNRVISTACAANEVSYAMSNLIYNEFVYHWISAINKKNPYGITVNADSNSDGLISMTEAFNYAEANDTRYETPQYYSGSGIGPKLSLFGLFPTISGSSTVEVCDVKTYTINGAHSCSNIQWQCSDNLQILRGQGTNSITVKVTGFPPSSMVVRDPTFVKATISTSNFTYNIPVFRITIPPRLSTTPTYNYYTTDRDLIMSNSTISGTFTIRSSHTVTIRNANVRCTPNAKIIIQPGGKLIINGSTLTNYCDGGMWQGIVVEGNSLLSQTQSNQGNIILENGATIEHAIMAITTSSGSKSGGIIHATDATFRNNKTAVKVYPYGSPKLVAPLHQGSFTHCNFIVDRYNFFAANGLSSTEQVHLYGINMMQFQGCDFKNTSATTVNIGIRTQDVGLLVHTYCPPDRISTLCTCPEGIRSSFSGFTTGIYINTTGSQNNIIIDECNFSNNLHSISVHGTNNVRITRSYFDLTGIGAYGVLLQNSTGYKVEENYFYCSSDMTTTSKTGIYIYESGVVENSIYRNNFINLYNGIALSGNNGSTDLTKPGLQFTCNNFTDVSTGISSSYALIRAKQGELTKGADNDFINVTYGLRSSQQFNYFYSNHDYYHTPPNYGSQSFYLVNNATANSCISTLCRTIGPITPYPLLSEGALDQYDLLSENLFQEKLQYENIANSIDQLSLMDNRDIISESSDIIASANEIIENISSLSVILNDISQQAIYEILQDPELDLSQLVEWYRRMPSVSADYSLVETYYQKGDYTLADNVLASMLNNPEYDEEQLSDYQNYTRFHALKNALQQTNRYWDALTQEEIDELISIAEASNKRSSSMAKGVLCFFYDICYEDNISLEESSQRNISMQKQINSTLSDIKVYPNPAKDYLNISFSEFPEGNVLIQLFDVSGQCVYTEVLKNKDSVIPLHDLSNGIYFYRITCNGELLTGEKVIKN